MIQKEEFLNLLKSYMVDRPAIRMRTIIVADAGCPLWVYSLIMNTLAGKPDGRKIKDEHLVAIGKALKKYGFAEWLDSKN